MAKMTAGLFASLPEELQEKILTEVPATELNNIEVITPNDANPEADSDKISELLASLNREEALVCILQMATMMSKAALPADLPSELRLFADRVLIERVVTETKQMLAEDDEDGN